MNPFRTAAEITMEIATDIAQSISGKILLIPLTLGLTMAVILGTCAGWKHLPCTEGAAILSK